MIVKILFFKLYNSSVSIICKEVRVIPFTSLFTSRNVTILSAYL